MDKSNVNRFDNASANWDDDTQRHARSQKIVEKILQKVFLDKSSNILDYGCGTGLATLALSRIAGSVTGVDSSSGMLEALRQKAAQQGAANVALVHTDYSEPAFHDLGPFDAVVSAMTLHHIRKPVEFASAVYRVIKPGGYILIADLDKEDGAFHQDKTGVYHSGFAAEEFKNILESAGFEDIDVDLAYSMHKNGKDYPVLLAVGKKR